MRLFLILISLALSLYILEAAPLSESKTVESEAGEHDILKPKDDAEQIIEVNSKSQNTTDEIIPATSHDEPTDTEDESAVKSEILSKTPEETVEKKEIHKENVGEAASQGDTPTSKSVIVASPENPHLIDEKVVDDCTTESTDTKVEALEIDKANSNHNLSSSISSSDKDDLPKEVEAKKKIPDEAETKLNTSEDSKIVLIEEPSADITSNDESDSPKQGTLEKKIPDDAETKSNTSDDSEIIYPEGDEETKIDNSEELIDPKTTENEHEHGSKLDLVMDNFEQENDFETTDREDTVQNVNINENGVGTDEDIFKHGSKYSYNKNYVKHENQLIDEADIYESESEESDLSEIELDQESGTQLIVDEYELGEMMNPEEDDGNIPDSRFAAGVGGRITQDLFTQLCLMFIAYISLICHA